MNYISTSKKQRGVGRRVRAIERWKNENSQINLDSLTIAHSKHITLHNELFQQLLEERGLDISEKNIKKIKRIILKSMIEVYTSIENIIKEEYNDYYLKLWIYPHNFIDSQIVLAIEEKISYYENIFEMEIENKNINTELDAIANFKWKPYMDHVVIGEGKYLGYDEELNKVKEKAFKIKEEEICGEIERYYYVSKGTIWVGEKI